MILEIYPSQRPVLVPALPWKGKQQQQQHGVQLKPTAAAVNNVSAVRPHLQDKEKATQIGITPEEYVRRDNIVRNIWIKNMFKVGDVLDCYDKKDRDDYGNITVKQIFTNYSMFPLNEAKDWPKDDKPYTMTVKPEKKEQLILCTPSWLTTRLGLENSTMGDDDCYCG